MPDSEALAFALSQTDNIRLQAPDALNKNDNIVFAGLELLHTPEYETFSSFQLILNRN